MYRSIATLVATPLILAACSFSDKRSAFGIVGFEGAVPTGQIEWPGARYVVSTTVNPADLTVTITGQTSRTVTINWAELP